MPSRMKTNTPRLVFGQSYRCLHMKYEIIPHLCRIFRVVTMPATNVLSEVGGDIAPCCPTNYSGRSDIILGGAHGNSIDGASSGEISPGSHRVLLLNSN